MKKKRNTPRVNWRRQLKTYDDVRDLSINIVEFLIDQGVVPMDGEEEDWYPWGIQDAITELIQEFTGIEEPK